MNIAVGRVGLYDDEDGSTFGDDSRKLKTRQHLNWHVGEIHITHPDIRPDTPRSSLELDTPARTAVGLIRSFYEDCIVVSRARNLYLPQVQLLEEAEAALGDPASLTHDRIASFRQRLEAQEVLVEERQTRDRVKVRLRQMLGTRALNTRRQTVMEQLRAATPAAPPQPASHSATGASGANGGRTRGGASARPDPAASAASQTGGAARQQTGGQPVATGASASADGIGMEQLLSESLAAVEEVLGEDDDLCREVCEAIQGVFVQHGFINA